MATKMSCDCLIKPWRPAFAYLREQDLSSVIYVDDSLLGDDEFEGMPRKPWVLYSS